MIACPSRPAPTSADDEIGQIAFMRPLGVHRAVLGARRVPMATCTGEVGGVAAPDGMHMCPMRAGREIVHIERQSQATRHFGRGRATDIGTVRRADLRHRMRALRDWRADGDALDAGG